MNVAQSDGVPLTGVQSEFLALGGQHPQVGTNPVDQFSQSLVIGLFSGLAQDANCFGFGLAGPILVVLREGCEEFNGPLFLECFKESPAFIRFACRDEQADAVPAEGLEGFGQFGESRGDRTRSGSSVFAQEIAVLEPHRLGSSEEW